MNEDYKQVYFDKYCKLCKHEKLEEKFEPCNECLGEPVNTGSRVPVNWEEKEK